MSENRKNNFIRQGSILAIASIIVRLIGIVYRFPLVNILHDEGNGIYSAAFEVYSLALILSSYSLPLAVSKLLSAQLARKQYRNANKIFKACFVFAVCSGGVIGLILFFGAGFIEKHLYKNFVGITIPLRILAITVFVVAILGVFRGFFQSRKTMIPTAISQIVEQIINAIASIIFALVFLKIYKDSQFKAGWGAAGSTMGTLLGALAGLVFLVFVFFIYRPIMKRQIRKDHTNHEYSYKSIYKLLFATIGPVILGQTIYQASGVIDSMMFSNLAKGDNVSALYGIFSTKYKLLINVPIAVSSAMASSMIPTIVASFANNKIGDIKRKISMSVKFNMIVAFPSAVGLAVLGGPIVRLLFPGSDYKLGGSLLLSGGIAVVLYALSTVTNAALQGINLMKKPMHHAAVSLGFHVVLMFILLKFTRLGIYSLIIGYVTYPLLVCILNAIAIKKAIGYKQDYMYSFIIPAISSIIMGIISFLMYKLGMLITKSNTISCILSIIFAVIIYFVTILLLGGIKEKDLPDFPMGMRIGRLAKKLHLM